MTEQRKLVYQLKLPVRWADMDINGHVNNTQFFTYFEAARIAWLDSVRARNARSAEGAVVAQATCNYRRSIPYPETLDIRVSTSAPGRSSFTTFYDVFSDGDESVKYADGQVVMVWVNRATGKSLPMPDFVRAALAPVHP
jgi:acyl-CoA thioester hydrolase